MSTIVRQGKLRGDKIRYDTETWCCVWIWQATGVEGEEEIGHCFDFHAGDLDDMIALMQKLKAMEADVAEGE